MYNMNLNGRNRIWLFAGLGVLVTCVSIMAAKKYKGKKNNFSGNTGASASRYKERVQ